MASRIAVLNHYRPQIKYGPTVQRRELVEYIAQHTTLDEGGTLQVLMELRDAIVHNNSHGRGVRLGTYLPNINYRGMLDVSQRLDRELKRDLNAGEGRPTPNNRKSIGRTPDEIVALWDREHPNDPER